MNRRIHRQPYYICLRLYSLTIYDYYYTSTGKEADSLTAKPHASQRRKIVTPITRAISTLQNSCVHCRSISPCYNETNRNNSTSVPMLMNKTETTRPGMNPNRNRQIENCNGPVVPGNWDMRAPGPSPNSHIRPNDFWEKGREGNYFAQFATQDRCAPIRSTAVRFALLL